MTADRLAPVMRACRPSRSLGVATIFRVIGCCAKAVVSLQQGVCALCNRRAGVSEQCDVVDFRKALFWEPLSVECSDKSFARDGHNWKTCAVSSSVPKGKDVS